MKYITRKEYMELLEMLKESFAKIDQRFDRIDHKFAAIDAQFIEIRNDIKYLGTRVDFIENNMVNKSQFNSLLIILENKELISSFEKGHILYKNTERLE